jgi:L-alanine-DL-glutamate epimerase-like enolase superfamily enzyme
MRPLLQGQHFDGPVDVFAALTRQTTVLAIQSGEPGPIGQAIAGIDLALWDLCARRAGQPLWRYLGGASGNVGVYASGINPDQPQDTISDCQQEGHTAFKLKIGFGREKDLSNLEGIRKRFGDDIELMADANQAWSVDEARDMAQPLGESRLGWLEEPLRADRPLDEWNSLVAVCNTPLAGGENVIGEHAFLEMVNHAAVRVVQPDVAKWGGISGCWPVIQAIHANGKRYCPHYLGAGVGLLASAHLLAAVGGTGLLEIDANPNPLRSALAMPMGNVVNGAIALGDAPGIGVPVDLAKQIPMHLCSH